MLHISDEEIPLDSGIAEVTNLPALDLDKLASLQAVLPTAAVRDLLRLYMLDTDNHLALMRERKSSGDLDAIARASHVIVSTAGNMGADQVSALARLLTDACREGNVDAVVRLVDELVAASVVTSDTIHSWLEGTAAVHEAPAEARG
jgi:HPt (histidine-containing phosphotransfer) domain-containing protein